MKVHEETLRRWMLAEDLDGTEMPLYAKQEGRFFRYLPLVYLLRRSPAARACAAHVRLTLNLKEGVTYRPEILLGNGYGGENPESIGSLMVALVS